MINNTSKLMQATLFASVLIFTEHAPAADAGGAAMNQAEYTTEVTVQAVGVVRSIDTAAGTITLAHDPIPALNWPAMTMGFKIVGDAAENIEVGQKVKFELQGEGTALSVTKIEKTD